MINDLRKFSSLKIFTISKVFIIYLISIFFLHCLIFALNCFLPFVRISILKFINFIFHPRNSIVFRGATLHFASCILQSRLHMNKIISFLSYSSRFLFRLRRRKLSIKLATLILNFILNNLSILFIIKQNI